MNVCPNFWIAVHKLLKATGMSIIINIIHTFNPDTSCKASMYNNPRNVRNDGFCQNSPTDEAETPPNPKSTSKTYIDLLMVGFFRFDWVWSSKALAAAPSTQLAQLESSSHPLDPLISSVFMIRVCFSHIEASFCHKTWRWFILWSCCTVSNWNNLTTLPETCSWLHIKLRNHSFGPERWGSMKFVIQ